MVFVVSKPTHATGKVGGRCGCKESAVQHLLDPCLHTFSPPFQVEVGLIDVEQKNNDSHMASYLSGNPFVKTKTNEAKK